jgi:4-hydroxybenzoate polyprenyltransferase
MPRFKTSPLAGFRRTLVMIKFEHSVFALPFALLGALLAARRVPAPRALGWIVIAMVAARSAAMTFNRIADRDLDRENPRTRNRALVTGELTVAFAWTFLAGSAVLFEVASWELNRLAFLLSPLALGWILFYSWTKRFTALSHFALGLSLGISPAAAWIAVRGSLSPRILLLSAAVTLWVAGFDILYSCQDYEIDRRSDRLFSLPKRVGIKAALRIAAALHAGVILLLALLLQLSSLGALAWVGLALVAILLWYENSLVKPDDLSRLNAAFFTVNGYIGVLLLVCWGTDILLHHA